MPALRRGPEICGFSKVPGDSKGHWRASPHPHLPQPCCPEGEAALPSSQSLPLVVPWILSFQKCICWGTCSKIYLGSVSTRYIKTYQYGNDSQEGRSLQSQIPKHRRLSAAHAAPHPQESARASQDAEGLSGRTWAKAFILEGLGEAK